MKKNLPIIAFILACSLLTCGCSLNFRVETAEKDFNNHVYRMKHTTSVNVYALHSIELWETSSKLEKLYSSAASTLAEDRLEKMKFINEYIDTHSRFENGEMVLRDWEHFDSYLP